MRLLHTMLRVGDLDKSIQFYRDIMGDRNICRTSNSDYHMGLVQVSALT